MKNYKFELSQNNLQIFFPHQRIKSKTKILEILLEATRLILCSAQTIKFTEPANKVILNIDKMSRLFFITQNKYYSIIFPFTAIEDDDKLTFMFRDEINIDPQIISHIISIIKSDTFNSSSSLDLADEIYELENEYNQNFWTLLRELLTLEDGYIRYDKDEIGHKEAVEKGKKHIHPLNHCDIFYSNKGAFKLGLENEICEEEFIDVLNTKTDCKYLRNCP